MAKTLILLSLNPQHWPLKEYGYRRRFPKDAVQAYSYLVLDNHPELRDFIQAWHCDGAR